MLEDGAGSFEAQSPRRNSSPSPTLAIAHQLLMPSSGTSGASLQELIQVKVLLLEGKPWHEKFPSGRVFLPVNQYIGLINCSPVSQPGCSSKREMVSLLLSIFQFCVYFMDYFSSGTLVMKLPHKCTSLNISLVSVISFLSIHISSPHPSFIIDWLFS